VPYPPRPANVIVQVGQALYVDVINARWSTATWSSYLAASAQAYSRVIDLLEAVYNCTSTIADTISDSLLDVHYLSSVSVFNGNIVQYCPSSFNVVFLVCPYCNRCFYHHENPTGAHEKWYEYYPYHVRHMHLEHHT
jgi:hypothetical protein